VFPEVTNQMQVEFEIIQPRLCQFVRNWSLDDDRSIENMLDSLPNEHKSLSEELFKAILKYDMQRRRKENAPISNDDYITRFPRWKTIVEEVDSEVTRKLDGKTGKVVDKKYTVGQIIGQGGMSCVYEVFNEETGAKEAIKFLKIDDKQKRRQRLDSIRNEIQISQLLHSFVKAHDYGEYLDAPFLVMERVYGEDLCSRVKRETLDWRKATLYVKKVADILQEFHKKNYVHCDVKPENIMIDAEGNVRILDFGFARQFPPEKQTKSPNSEFVGTEAYAPPEAWKGTSELDPRSDLYCLGGTYLFLLTKHRPDEWFNPKNAPKPSCSLSVFLTKKGVNLPSRVVRVLTRLLEPDRETRYQTAQEVANDLNDLIKPRLTFRRSVALTFLCVVALAGAYFQFGYDQAKLKRAVNLEQQGNLENAIAEVKNVCPGRLSSSNRFNLFMLQARGCVAKGEYVEALASTNNSLQTFERLSDSRRSNVNRVGARDWATQSLSNRAPNDKNQEKAISSFVDASEKVAEFFKKSPVSKTSPEEEARLLTALALDWLACSCIAYGNNDDLTKLSENVKRSTRSFPYAQKIYGDLLSEKARRSFASEEKQDAASRAIAAYESFANRPGATNCEKRATLQNMILTCDYIRSLNAGIEACERLLKIDSESKFARRYRGRFRLLRALATLPQSVERGQKDEILDDLSFASKGCVSKEERYDILIETAVAALALGVVSSEAINKISREDCDKCVEAITNALEVAPERPVYVINEQEWNAFDIRRQANKIIFERYDPNKNLLVQIREDAKMIFGQDSQVETYEYY